MEKSRLKKTDFLGYSESLRRLMRSDSNVYVQFRSAFALAAHGIRDAEVKGVLYRALKDKDTARIARGYLRYF